MKKFLGTILLASFVFINSFAFVGVANAWTLFGTGSGSTDGTTDNSTIYNTANGPCSSASGKICNPIKATSIDNLLTGILAIVKFVAGIVLVIYFILAGFKYVTARGDETKIKAAHSMLTWTAVGGAILLGAEVIQRLISGTISQLGTGL
jgi:hypothetical protein